MKDKSRPLFHWYVDCATGKELVLALYTRPCRYGRCAFCALPAMSEGGESISPADIEAQIDYILSSYNTGQISAITKVSVYTASSSLDQECMPTRSLLYLALRISNFPSVQQLSLETRPEYVEDWELRMLQEVFSRKVAIEVGIGYETYSPELRNEVLKKGLSREALHRLMQQLSDNQCRLKAYLMLKPHHSLSEEEGIKEALLGLEELKNLSHQYGVPVSVHLNPTYIPKGCRLSEEMKAAGYLPPELSSVIAVLKQARALDLNIYAGLDDEGMAVEGGTFRTTGFEKKSTVQAILQFNRHQNTEILMKEIKMQ